VAERQRFRVCATVTNEIYKNCAINEHTRILLFQLVRQRLTDSFLSHRAAVTSVLRDCPTKHKEQSVSKDEMKTDTKIETVISTQSRPLKRFGMDPGNCS